ncbi:DegV family protein [Paramaledivibacter caminithermalis]|jgi:DegV family protein with EDD domain|uniref:EDD domain protein, DegV family n=1 Tax=Paramaledivibacter caminithermalis (strain DSM 15212 / CIP 107654 / DViRD3) TaxID=1121301 RepID=A0A1M6ST35_PARC5|nr:DegV family protein [Paramaledivibacter caminithermalis]SHK47883.1 EDD domain protein, DegV family [Paramaledivibacter caminithermalis DSM 15212]
MNIKVIGDSCFDMNKELKKLSQICLAPLKISVGEKMFKDDENLDQRTLLDLMKKSDKPPKTASPSPNDFLERYKGEEDVFVVTLSSELSGSYSSAVLAKKMYLEDSKDKFIHVFDSLSASVGETLVGLKILELVHLDCKRNQIIERVDEYIKDMKTFFLLESLDNLIKAGRINKIVAKLATAFSIKPIMGSTDKGTIRLVEKARGSKKALRRLVDLIGEQGERLEEKIIGIAHCNCFEKAQKLKDEIKKRYKFKDIIIVETAGISTVYANDGGIIIAF